MRIAVCDDDPRGQEQFEEALRGCDPALSAEKYLSGASLLEAAKGEPRFDIVFLDIYMPGENGIDIAKSLKKNSPETGIVFVTSSSEHAVEAFALYAIHYLVKPVTPEGIKEALKRLHETRFVYRERITFKSGADTYTVYTDRICLAESDNHTVDVLMADGQRLKVRMSFSELEKKLNGNFLRINRGILVNMDYIIRMGKETCTLQNGIKRPLTTRHNADIRATYDDYVFEKLAGKSKNDIRGGVSDGGFSEKCDRIFYTGTSV